MGAVYRKELRSYFTSMTGYIYLAAFLAISGFIFSTGNLLSQNADIKSFFASISTVLIFLVPILTMRLLSEERKLRTLQLLLTMPISIGDIVLGKFLAALTVFALGLAATLVYPLILAKYGGVEAWVAAGNYIGMILLVATCIAIGLFISALTENQIVAAILTYVVLLGLSLLDSSTTGIRAEGLWRILRYASLNSHFSDFANGIFNPADIVFFLAVTLTFLAFSALAVDARRSA
ncbi:MAG: ABC transporter permease subunit [Variovorax sp.]